LNLEFCMDALNEMKATHHSAARCHELLQGATVSPHEHREGSARSPDTFPEFSGSRNEEYISPDAEKMLRPIFSGEHNDPALMTRYIWSDLPSDHEWDGMRSSMLNWDDKSGESPSNLPGSLLG